MSKYRKKPVVIEAIQWTGENLLEICNFTGRCGGELLKNGEMYIDTLEGVHHASVGDFIIKGVNGELYPCKPDIFGKTYNAEYPSTNADRYRAMSDEELARTFAQTGNCPPSPKYGHNCERCSKCWLDYLRHPAKDGDNDVD